MTENCQGTLSLPLLPWATISSPLASSKNFSQQLWESTWRIIPVSKWLITRIYKPFPQCHPTPQRNKALLRGYEAHHCVLIIPDHKALFLGACSFSRGIFEVLSTGRFVSFCRLKRHQNENQTNVANVSNTHFRNTPTKINMSPESGPFQKETGSSSNHHFSERTASFRGSTYLC